MSNRFNHLVYESAKKLRLKRVQIKSDPRFADALDFSCVSTYEGYILEESGESVSIIVIKQDLPIISVPPQSVEETPEVNLNSFKLAGFKKYIAPLFQSGDPLYDQINKASSVEEIESLMIQNNVSSEKFVQMLRKFINNKLISEDITAPSFVSNLGQFAKNATRAGLSNLANPGAAAQRLAGLSTQLQHGNYGQIAAGIKQHWNIAVEQNSNKLIHKFEWPQGMPKRGDSIIIINENSPKINRKTIKVNNAKKTKDATVYYGDLIGVAGNLGSIGVIISISNDAFNSHSANVKFTEGRTISQTLTKFYTRGDQYVLQYNSRKQQFELIEDILGTTNKSFKERELTVICDKNSKVGEEGIFITVMRSGSYLDGQKLRAKLVSAPIFDRHKQHYYAHATPL